MQNGTTETVKLSKKLQIKYIGIWEEISVINEAAHIDYKMFQIHRTVMSSKERGKREQRESARKKRNEKRVSKLILRFLEECR